MTDGTRWWAISVRFFGAMGACSWALASAACFSDNSSPGASPDGSAAMMDGGASSDTGGGADGTVADSQSGSPDANTISEGGTGADAGGGGDSGASDPYFSNVVLLMHFDGPNASTNFVDVKGHAVTPQGAVALSTTTSALGGASGYFDGSSAWLSLAASEDWNFYAADFTVELFASFSSAPSGSPTFLSLWGSSEGWEFFYGKSNPGNDIVPNTLTFVFSLTGADEIPPAAPWMPAVKTWYHLASVRHGADFLFFVNGSLIGSQTLGGDGGPLDWTQTGGASWVADAGVAGNVSIHDSTGTPFGLGAGVTSNGTPNPITYVNGYLDEMRITKGVARYTANFTPPTQEFPNQ
jgi:hypothetical protein